MGVILSRAAVLVVLLGPTAAIAQEVDPAAREEARRLFDDAVPLLEARQFAEAVAPLRRSLELFPNLPTAFNLAVAMTHAGETQAAIALFEDILEATYGELSITQRADTITMLRGARADLATLRIRASGAPSIRIHIDGQHVGDVVGGAELAWTVDAGEHVVGASAEGFESIEQPVEVRRGQRRRVTLEIGELPGGSAARERSLLSASPTRREERVDDAGWDPAVALWIGAGAAVVAGVVVAVVLLSDPGIADPVGDPVLPIVETLRF